MVFRSPGTAWFTIAYPSALIASQNHGLVFLNPFPPLGGAFVSRYWPVSLTPTAAYSYIAQCTDPAGRPVQVGQCICFHQIQGIWHSGGDVLVNGTRFLALGDQAAAAFYSAVLTDIWLTPAERRESAIEAALRVATDSAAIEAKVKTLGKQSKMLRVWCNGLFVLLFIVLPASMWLWQIRSYHWSFLAAALFACITAIAIEFHSAHKQLFPDALQSRWKALAMILLMPTTAIRACDLLSKQLLVGHDPLAIAAVVCPSDRFLDFSRRVLLDLKYTALPVCPPPDQEPVVAEHTLRVRHFAESLVRRQGYSLDVLMAPPEPEETQNLSFCPRCDAQYVTPRGVCNDCGGIPLQGFRNSSLIVDAPMEVQH